MSNINPADFRYSHATGDIEPAPVFKLGPDASEKVDGQLSEIVETAPPALAPLVFGPAFVTWCVLPVEPAPSLHCHAQFPSPDLCLMCKLESGHGGAHEARTERCKVRWEFGGDVNGNNEEVEHANR